MNKDTNILQLTSTYSSISNIWTSDMALKSTNNKATSLEELLTQHDESFINMAYQTLLGRAPDTEGSRYYLNRLRNGISKIEILTQLRRSSEGKKRDVNVTGLDKAITHYVRLKTPLLGAILRLVIRKETDDVEQNLRAINNKLSVLNTQIRQGLLELNQTVANLQQTNTPNEINNNSSKKAEITSTVEGIFAYPSELEINTYDPIGDRYDATLIEIKLRLQSTKDVISDSSQKIKISILMPVYKVPLIYLNKAIESVRYQTYQNWELCIVDDGSADIALADYLRKISTNDSRIKTEIVLENRGISSATNFALAMATGDFIAFLDNDDMLTNDAIECIASAIEKNPSLDLIYSDECKIDENDTPIEIFTKPDWSPLTLFNCMYSGHFSAYRKSLVEKIGGLRSTYDFSQDYDLVLRISELTNNVHHIGRILYGWRMIAGSGAQGDKPYARATNIAALQDACRRRDFIGEVYAEPVANHFRVSIESMTQKVSIVIPSDNIKNIQDTIDSIYINTRYKNYEIIVVTNSNIIKKLETDNLASNIHLAAYDKVFNFSEKCNEGAKLASGEIIVFYNDDVRVVSQDWIEMILECFIHSNVGIVGPKLLYENYLIQHAGMVTGVRGLVGTAFHCLPHETTKHFGAALWMREVSLICGACLAIKNKVFNDVGGFDAINAPISHSDVDLCFRVRDKGYSCLYTPHATLIHIGHMSIAEAEKKEFKQNKTPKKDKSDIFLLRQWGHHTSYDPYFPPAMRDILYHDSPEKWQLHANVPPAATGGKDVLLISHDLSGSGAPRIIYEIATLLLNAGHFVVVASPCDGDYRERLNEIGVPVIIDELLLKQHTSLERFAKNFDLVIANTVVTWPAVKLLSGVVDTYWYIHEMSLLQYLVDAQPEIKDIFKCAKQVWAGSEHAAANIRPYRQDIQILKYGVKPLITNTQKSKINTPIKINVFGSYEPRKGQDLAVIAFEMLPEEFKSKIKLSFFGRVLDENIYNRVQQAASKYEQISLSKELTYEEYKKEMLACDAVLITSRDDTLPFVSIDALGASKLLICTNTTGTSNYIEHSKSGFISVSTSPPDIANVLIEVINNLDKLESISLCGNNVFESEFSVSSYKNAFFYACGL